MFVEQYDFGRITVEGQSYSQDVLILAEEVHSPWWRREGHRLATADLEVVWTDPPEFLVIGNGYYGNMDVPGETLEDLRQRGVKAWVGRTAEAVAEFNRLREESARVAAALHLTC